MNYYNENDTFAADWLENLITEGLIPNGKVDRRSIADVQANDVRGFTQCHFFAGIGGWSLALQLAGWNSDRPAWTGSCPCQPFSQAGKQKAQADERHLWPEMFRLIRQCQPDTVFGEQVASAIGHGWLDGIQGDLEREGYAVAHCVLGAGSVGAPHKRSRLYWVAKCGNITMGNTPHERRDNGTIDDNRAERNGFTAGTRSADVSVGNSNSYGRKAGIITSETAGHGGAIDSDGGNCSLGNTSSEGLEGRASTGRAGKRIIGSPSVANGSCSLGNSNGSGRRPQSHTSVQAAGIDRAMSPWSDFRIIKCTDGKKRRVGTGVQPLVNGIPCNMGQGKPELSRLAKRARANRVGRLKGYGNAIVPQVAAEFVMAFMDCKPN